MACIYRRKGSPYWWIKKKDAAGKWIRESTNYRTDNAQETKLARSDAAQATSNELCDIGIDDSHRWDHWVDRYLASHCNHEPTRKGYEQSWKWLRSYLAERDIATPAQLAYADAFGFLEWRMQRGAKRVGTTKSTALRDIKVLRLLMRHAVRSGMAAGNPCDRMGIERPEPKIKNEISDKGIRLIYKNLTNEPVWMELAFSICLLTGCRISEANLERLKLDYDRRTITFLNPKGGTKRAFTTVLPDQLKAIILAKLKRYDTAELVPPKTASQQFSKFFRKIGMKGYSIHCTRVTYISRLARSGVKERLARLAVNHASEAVHRTYQRLGVEDLQAVRDAVNFPVTVSRTKTRRKRGEPSRRRLGSQGALKSGTSYSTKAQALPPTVEGLETARP